VGGGGGQREDQHPKMSGRARFQGGGGQREDQHPKMSGRARF
jgi:hypothetical protein